MKKTILAFLIVFSFFFMRFNVFADTKTCKYSLSNVSRKVVGFDDYGKAYLNSGQSEITDKNDHNLVMKITDPADGTVSNLANHVKFSIEGKKFSLDNSMFSHDLTKTYDIYYYKVNGGYAPALTSLKECPQLGILYHQKSSDKYVITNITIDTAGSNISDLVRVYKVGYSCTKAKKLLCYYSNGSSIYTSYEILASKNSVGLYKLVNTAKSDTAAYDKDFVNISDFKCNGGYSCPATTYYVADIAAGKNYPASFRVASASSRSVEQVKYSNSYSIPGSIYFMKVSLYDAKTNSGKSGNPEKNGGSTGSDPSFNGTPYQGTESFQKDCDKNPNSEKCKNLLSTASKKTFAFCDEKGVLKSLKIINMVITVAKILVPLLIIIYGSIDYGKAALSDDGDALEKTTQKLIKKIVVGVMIFMIPTIINSLISFSQSSKDKADANSGEFRKCALCFAGHKDCDNYIDSASK